MSEDLPLLTLSRDQEKNRIVVVTGTDVRASDPAGLATAASALASTPEGLASYCDALNFLARDTEYRVIHDPAAFVARYERRLAAEDPNAPWQEGVVRLRDFGVCDTSVIAAPSVVGEKVVFFAEDDFTGLPYQVTGPAPSAPSGDVQYEPVPVKEE